MKAGSNDCSRVWEVDAYREGRLGTKDAQSFERHMRTCSECDARFRRDERLRSLAARLPEVAPSELVLRRLRTRVLRDVATGAGADGALTPRARWALALSALGIAALVAGGFGVRRISHAPVRAQVESPPPSASMGSPRSEAFAGTVLESVGARWTQARQQGTERVSLDSGSLRIHVRHQHDGERFLVSLPDGELEVRGTTFQVTVADGSTTRVHVEEGVVALRLDGRPEVRLAAGDTWAAPVAEPAQPSSAPALAPVRASPVRSVAATHPVAPPPPPPPAVQAPSASEDDAESAAYAAAVTLLRDGRNADAVAAFQSFVAKHASAPQLEDASFLEAVALARMGRVDAAALAAEEHLARFPSSFHRREAEALIARAHGSPVTTK